MNKKTRIILMGIAVLLLMMAIVFACIFFINKNDKKVIFEEKVVKDFTINIASMEYVDNRTSIVLNIKNNSSEAKEFGFVRLIFKDKKNNVLSSPFGGYSGIINPNEEVVVKTDIDKDITSSYKCDYELIGEIQNDK